MMVVYKVTSPSNKIYIGITKNFNIRKKSHISLANNGAKLAISRAIRKYGSNLKWEIIDNAKSVDEAKELEKKYISLFDTLNSGYNMTCGGDGMFGYSHTKENKKKLREYRIGLDPWNKGKKNPYSEDVIRLMSLAKKGKPSPRKGCKVKDTSIKKQLEAKNIIPIIVYKTGVFIGRWSCYKKCSSDLELSYKYMHRCLKHGKKCNGYIFEYEVQS